MSDVFQGKNVREMHPFPSAETNDWAWYIKCRRMIIICTTECNSIYLWIRNWAHVHEHNGILYGKKETIINMCIASILMIHLISTTTIMRRNILVHTEKCRYKWFTQLWLLDARWKWKMTWYLWSEMQKEGRN